MPAECSLARKKFVGTSDISEVPLIFHRRAGLQQRISHWAQTDIENLNIAATYNVINGSPTEFIKSGLGCFLTTEDLLSPILEDGVCFRPLNPPLEIQYALIWKRSAILSKAAETFLEELKQEESA
ncbi:MAG: LysR family transcriptional regulator substrate-binding protein [Eubacterium sp.]